MQPDDELCLCFHVSKRKVVNFLRVEKPQRVSQLSQCQGAGTGCGWCRTLLGRLFDAAKAGVELAEESTAGEHAQGRAAYVRAGHGTPPPGGSPLPDPPQ